MTAAPLTLSHGLEFADLYRRDGLVRLDAAFCDWLKGQSVELFNRLMAARADADGIDGKAESDLITALAPLVEQFLGLTFGISAKIADLQARHNRLAPLAQVKRLFVQRYAAKAVKAEELAGYDPAAIDTQGLVFGADLPAFELAFATAVQALLGPDLAVTDATRDAAAPFARYAAWALTTPDGQARHKAGVLFKQPHKLDMERLVPVVTETVDGVTRLALPKHDHRARDGFALTDHGCDLTGALDQANYCIWCHHQGKDSCSKGLKDKDGSFRKSPFGVPLNGCPLEEKISEMNEVKAQGFALGALAIVTIDNPMAAGTGHRICNDCMKACVYQKQDPVDIPQIESRTLKDVLDLPWGFEIYSLLTRWNPLNIRRPLPKAPTGAKVLVVGLGPAGYTLAHHLMNDGHAVFAVDGLKIEPLPETLSGVAMDGRRVPFRPIREWRADLYEPLDSRVNAGFGGVAEYGITVRWDKNFLKVIRLLLERRAEFAMYGGVRFGGTLTVDQAFDLGFDHIALCAGAGRPTVIDMPNNLAKGVRQASDFLMALQLTGAARPDSIANLQIRLPVVVIGGGLTGIDTTTEALAYYPIQVEKFLARYEALVAEQGEAAVRAGWSEEDRAIAKEFIAHGRALRAEKAKGDRADVIGLLQSWGGATLAYRRRLLDAPSYTLNHEEVAKALEEGIWFVENATPDRVEVDRFGSASALIVSRKQPDGSVREERLAARTVLVAAGTQPNTVLAREDGQHARIDGKYFQAYDESGVSVSPERSAKPGTPQVLMHLAADGRAISFFGDLHPSFAGNVVKAMGSAKQGYPVVSRMLARRAPSPVSADALRATLDDGLRPRVAAIHRLTPTIVEVVLRAPFAAKAFHPGQFYRLQNYETQARRVGGPVGGPDGTGTLLAMEGLALTGAWTDPDAGLVSTIVLEMGGSSDLCALLHPGEPVVLMGPTGEPTETPAGETVLLAGGGLGNAVLFSIGQSLRRAGSRVVYFAGYKKLIDRYKVEQIEAAADIVIWCSDEAPGFTLTRPHDRPHDRSVVGNIVEAMRAYAAGELYADAGGIPPIPMAEVQRIIAIGSDRMMAAVAAARHGVLKPYLQPCHTAIGSINSPMQCMMKEICAQCLQRHRDPVTGKEWTVFSCYNQDQALDHVDWQVLNDRLQQNAVQEKLTRRWIDRSLKQLALRPAAE